MDPAIFELGTDGPKRILVGVDGSETSMHAGAYAAGLARRQQATLVVLYVKPMATAAANAETIAAIRQGYEEFATELRRDLHAYAQRVGFDVEYEYAVREGSPYHELVKLAEELKVDAIVVGASTSAGHRLVGSLATKLVRRAKWPVTVVP